MDTGTGMGTGGATTAVAAITMAGIVATTMVGGIIIAIGGDFTSSRDGRGRNYFAASLLANRSARTLWQRPISIANDDPLQPCCHHIALRRTPGVISASRLAQCLLLPRRGPSERSL